eukprot:Plantae.Rhodophyta-Hildenbrandia_rubra.ctg13992.p2 GENE.Plantae.Rhodophyta-Hildenbrandia_rubra.ctg13992~~Plantae.Rhodophyta-Hildenbrandia_rubra.ctg13992.p2  ORF type:complete len:206 (+),score=32.22 Plantae.Rhodophyta-Hildenbrandia_rubra.ctg13992:912-1529(+)
MQDSNWINLNACDVIRGEGGQIKDEDLNPYGYRDDNDNGISAMDYEAQMYGSQTNTVDITESCKSSEKLQEDSTILSSPTNIFKESRSKSLSPLLCTIASSLPPLPPPSKSASSSSKPRRYACKRCPSKFAIRSNLKRHVKTVHFDIRAYECCVCHATFGLKHNLRTHVRAKHERRRPFACEDCGATFGYRQVLNNHRMNIHNHV